MGIGRSDHAGIILHGRRYDTGTPDQREIADQDAFKTVLQSQDLGGNGMVGDRKVSAADDGAGSGTVRVTGIVIATAIRLGIRQRGKKQKGKNDCNLGNSIFHNASKLVN